MITQPLATPSPVPATPKAAVAGGPPIQVFASVMGIASLGLAWRGAARPIGVPLQIGEGILAASVLLFIALGLQYLWKILHAPSSVRSEYADPIVSSYFGTVTISLSLFAAALVPYSFVGAQLLWIISAAASIVLLLSLLSRWISMPRSLDHITPAWFIPIVGCAVAVYAAVPLGFTEYGWALFSAALLCWLTIQPLVFYRLIFHDPLPRRLTLTLAILISSPAVLASAWYSLDGHVADAVFRLLVFKALFLAALVAIVSRFVRSATFSPAWWGYTFPAAAVAGAFVRYDDSLRSPLSGGLARATLAAASIITAYVAVRTIAAYGETRWRHTKTALK